ncbi:hypothetical protein BV898_08007 [Hypsibius exemplaris]|uniref:DDE Tnp4 domain-containing protein n=1 Tax=Hypsibius exemplaris TaxID=2072580 RepID=A0A1W0WRP1_HYPEX|nr:hypothetical protein BV898_08007 [Hypsibius exemplaris]
MAYADDSFDDEEFFLLLRRKDKDRPEELTPFSLDKIADVHCKKNFRFLPKDLQELCDALRFPAFFIADNRSKMPGLEGLCLLLRRLVYPVRLHDLEIVFGRVMSVLSRFFNIVADYVFDHFGHLLTDLNQPWLTEEKLKQMAAITVAKGFPFDKCVGFVDGTNIKLCRYILSN